MSVNNNIIFDKEIAWLSNDLFCVRKSFSQFEDYLLASMLNKNANLESQLREELKAFYCWVINNSYEENKLTVENISISDVAAFLENSEYHVYKFYFEPNYSGREDGSVFRLFDRFKLRELEVFLPYIEKEIQEFAKQAEYISPFFYFCRSDTFVRTVSRGVIHNILSFHSEFNYDDNGNLRPFWEIWDEEKGGKKYDSVHFLACYVFIWYRLKDCLDQGDESYNKYSKIAKKAEELLVDYQLGDGSWSWNSIIKTSDEETTCMAMHALGLSNNVESKYALRNAGRWLKKQWLDDDRYGSKYPFDDLFCIDSLALCYGERELLSFGLPVSESEKLNNNNTVTTSQDYLHDIDCKKDLSGGKIMNTKIFISHRSKDVVAAKALADFLADLGVPQESIVCTSVPDYLVPNGEDIYDWLRSQFTDYNLHVIFLLSKAYFESAPCLNEMGAAWVTKKASDVILLPGFSKDDIHGCLDKNKAFIRWDDDEEILMDRLNQLRDQICNEFNLRVPQERRWTTKRKILINTIKNNITTVSGS